MAQTIARGIAQVEGVTARVRTVPPVSALIMLEPSFAGAPAPSRQNRPSLSESEGFDYRSEGRFSDEGTLWPPDDAHRHGRASLRCNAI